MFGLRFPWPSGRAPETSEAEHCLRQERGDLRNKMQIIHSESRRLRTMAEALKLMEVNHGPPR
jgi:hypothetical protein